MKKIIFFVLIALSALSHLYAQKMVDYWNFTTGVNSNAWITLPANATTILTTDQTMSQGTYGGSSLCEIGFIFTLGESSHTKFSVNINGTMRLGLTGVNTSGYYTQPLGSNSGNGPKIEPFGARGKYDGSCYTKTALTGGVGNRVRVVETRMCDYSTNKHVCFQIQLFENGSGVRIVYGSSDTTSMTAKTQTGIVASSSDRDIVFIDLANNLIIRDDSIGDYISQTNPAGFWPVQWRWYRLAFNSAACPFPHELTVIDNNPTSLTFSGSTQSLHIVIPGTDIDTTFLQPQNSYTLPPCLNGGFTYEALIQNVCDNNNSYRFRHLNFTTACGDVLHLPWSADFGTAATSSCWDVSHTSNSYYNRWRRESGVMISGLTSGNYNCDDWLVSPDIMLPDSGGLTLKWDYKTQGYDNGYPLVYVRVAPCDSSGNVDNSMWTTIKTINSDFSSYHTLFASLDTFRGQRVKICFARSGSTGGKAIVDNIVVYNQFEPITDFNAPSLAFVGDTTLVAKTLTWGSTDSLQVLWTSTMAASGNATIVSGDTLLRIVYLASGIDTVRVILSNAYGSDTSIAFINVFDCRPITVFPWNEDFENGLQCWESPTNQSHAWTLSSSLSHRGSYSIAAFRNDSNHPFDTIVSRPIVIPTDAYRLILSFWVKHYRNNNPDVPNRHINVIVLDSSSTSWNDGDTLLHICDSMFYGESWRRFEINMQPFAGQSIRLMFEGSGYVTYSSVNVDDVELRYIRVPVISLDAPMGICQGDTLNASTDFIEGDTVGLTYTWSSSMASAGLANISFSDPRNITLTYSAGGIDTIIVTAANPFGSDSDTAIVNVCPMATSIPWIEEFDNDSFTYCWTYKGWHQGSSGNDMNVDNNTTNAYLLSPHLSIPDSNIDNLKIWVYRTNSADLELRISPSASLDTAQYYIPAGFSEPCFLACLGWNAIDITPYAGQTIRIGLFSRNYNKPNVHAVKIDYDTLPKICNISVPDKSQSDSTIICTSTLCLGSTQGFSYLWHSSLTGLSANTPSFSVTYGHGGIDTVTLIASNIFGADTMAKTVIVSDCYTAESLPWIETFDNGTACWYKPEGSLFGELDWVGTQHNDHLWINIGQDTLGSWIMSKAITIPTDTSLLPSLGWRVATTTTSFVHVYSMLVCNNDNYTDTSAYTTLFTDSSTHPHFYYHYDTLSVSLADYAGQTIHIAIHNQNSTYNYWWIDALYFDDIRIYNAVNPAVSVSADNNMLFFGDTATFTATLLEGSTDSLSFLWHSSLLDTSFYAGNTISLCYGLASGTDIVSVTATNIYGSGIASCAVNSNIITKPMAYLSAPRVYADNGICHIQTGDTITFLATRNHCVTTGMTYIFHSSLLDTTFSFVTSADSVRLQVVYPFAGNDTMTLTIVNTLDTSNAISCYAYVYSCSTFGVPFFEDFNGGTIGGIIPCWDGDSYCDGNSNGNIAARLTTYRELISPAIDIPADSTGLFLSWLTLSANGSSTIPVLIRVSPTGNSGIDSFTDTLFSGYSHANDCDSVSLDAYLGNRIRIRFSARDNYTLIDDIHIDYNCIPHVSLNNPDAMVGDTTTYVASASPCSPNGITTTWHSSLTNTTRTDSLNGGSFPIVYTTTGIDTVTVIVRNIYGSDTATRIVTVEQYPLPYVWLTVPPTISVGDTATFIATPNDCSMNGFSLSWHSSLLNITWTDTNYSYPSSFFNITYSFAGFDTISVTVTNNYGSHTASAVTSVIDCDNTAVPYFEDFNGITATPYGTAGFLPGCWRTIWNGSNTGHTPHVISNYPYIGSAPTDCVLLTAGNDSGLDTAAYVILPGFTDSLKNLSIAFDYRFESSMYGTLKVGYMVGNIFTPVKNIARHSGNYLRDTVSFNSISEIDANIALKWSNNGMWWVVFIDNVSVFHYVYVPAPDSLIIDSVTPSCVTMHWNAVDSVGTYHVTINNAGYSLDTIVYDTSLTVYNLLDDADYSASVACISGIDTSHRVYASFHTPLLCAQLSDVSFSQYSNSVDIFWQYSTLGLAAQSGVVIVVNDITTRSQWPESTATGNTTTLSGFLPGHRYAVTVSALCSNAVSRFSDTLTFALNPNICTEISDNMASNNYNVMNNFWSDNYSQTLYPASFASAVDTLYGIAWRIGGYDQSYEYSSNFKYDIYIGQTDSSTLSSPVSADSLTLVVNQRWFASQGTGWIDFVFDTIFVHDTSKNLIVTIVQRDGNPVYPYANPLIGLHIDSTCTHFVQSPDHCCDYTNPFSLNFTAVTTNYIPDIRLLGGCTNDICLVPELSISNIDTHSVSLSWHQRGSEEAWIVQQRIASVWTSLATTTDTFFTITNIPASSVIEFRIASLCGGDTLYSQPQTATTLCGDVDIPYHALFAYPNYKECWSVSDANNIGENGFYVSHFNYEDSYIISPLINADLNNVVVRVTAASAYIFQSSTYSVGVCDASGNNAVWIDTITLSPDTEITSSFYLNHYIGDNHNIIIQSISGASFITECYIDWIDECTPVQFISVSNITPNSALLTWPPENANNSWAIYLDDSLIAVSSSPNYHIGSLVHGTDYIAAVREICSPGDTSEARTCSFRTSCIIEPLPYFEDFNYNLPDFDEPPCWTPIYSGIWAGVWNAYNDDHNVLILNSSGDHPQWNYISSPPINVGRFGARVRVKANASGANTGCFYTGIMFDNSDSSSFHLVETIHAYNLGLHWYEFTTDTIPDCSNAEVYSIAFRWNSLGSGAIDSIIVEPLPIPSFSLSVVSADSSLGYTSGSGIFVAGTQTSIEAFPYDGNRFLQWNDGDTNAFRTVTIWSDTLFIAYFDTIPDTTTIGIAEIHTDSWHISPNPTSSSVTVSTSTAGTVTILDIHGRIVLRTKVEPGQTPISITHLPEGIYFVQHRNQVLKLVIK